MNEKFSHAFILNNLPKMLKPNKMTRNDLETQKIRCNWGRSSSLSGWCYDHGQETLVVGKTSPKKTVKFQFIKDSLITIMISY